MRSQSNKGGGFTEHREIIQLFEAYADDIFRLAFSYLHNRQDAEDICQAVFMKLLSNRNQPKPGREKVWLLTCTANACKDHLKSFWRRNTVELDDKLVFTSETDKELWTAVNLLAPKYRVVVHLYYYEGYSQDEIAEMLHLSRTAVQTRMSRARKQLKEVLSDHD